MIKMDKSQIKSYFNNKSIFITGATGFLGKVLIEKLLRTCCDLKCIYILIRGKKGKNISQRLDELFNSTHGLFDSVKSLYPNDEYKKKFVLVEGDLLDDDLGLSDQDKLLLINNVNIVFHSAATVRFDEPLKYII
jgi:fatty acyl-CoA reductase